MGNKMARGKGTSRTKQPSAQVAARQKKRASFGKRLTAARITAGYESAEAFADHIDIEPHAYRRYEREGVMPKIDILEKIVRQLGCDAGWLIFGIAQDQ